MNQENIEKLHRLLRDFTTMLMLHAKRLKEVSSIENLSKKEELDDLPFQLEWLQKRIADYQEEINNLIQK